MLVELYKNNHNIAYRNAFTQPMLDEYTSTNHAIHPAMLDH